MNNTTLWTYDTEDPIKSSPVVHDGRVYVGTMGGYVLCLDAFTGQVVWTYETDGPVESSPAVQDGRVYAGSDDTFIYCLDSMFGTLIWRTATDGEIKSSPVVIDGHVYVGSNDFSVHCMDALDGGSVWEFKTGGYVYSSPAFREGFVYFGSCDGNVYAVNATSGELFWNYTADFCPASPAVTEDLVIFGAYDGLLHYIERSTGEQVHTVPARFTEIYSSAGLFTYEYEEEYDLPMVFVATTGGKMIGMGPDGEEFWNASHASAITSSPLVVTEVEEPYDPFIVYGDEGGTLHGIEIHNPYQTNRYAYIHQYVEWHIKLGSSIQSSPFLWHNRTYVGVETGEGGRVVCIGSINEESEVYIEMWNTNLKEGEVRINFEVHNLEPDNVTVEFEGLEKEANRAYLTPWENPWNPPEPEPYPFANRREGYGTTFPATPPEGMKPFIIRLYVDNTVVLTYVGQVMCLVKGWAEVLLTVEEPKDQDIIEEGTILVASGTVSSNYTIRNMRAEWDFNGNRINITIQPNWTIALETADLERGTHLLYFRASDNYRSDSWVIVVHIGEPGRINGEGMNGDRSAEVGAGDIVAVLVLIVIFVYLLRTKPPRVSEDPSKR